MAAKNLLDAARNRKLKEDPTFQMAVLVDDFNKAQQLLIRRVEILKALRVANGMVPMHCTVPVDDDMEAVSFALANYKAKKKALESFEEIHGDIATSRPARWER